MTNTCTDYMYAGTWTKEFLRLNDINYHTVKAPVLFLSENTVILPARESHEHGWGSGGAIDETGRLIAASRLGDIFGEVYPFNQSELIKLNETVYYIPVIPKHWGHFLSDVLCRFWFTLDGNDLGCRIAYCTHEFGEEGITANYLETLELLGIEKDRLLYIDKPTRFSKVLIPGPTFGDGKAYSDEYLEIIQKIKKKVLESEVTLLPRRREKIYFTRTNFRRSKHTEVGEKRIEKLFQNNGFTVISPETLSVREQVYYFSTCKVIASLSGTIAHQLVFSDPGNQYIILNRCCLPNYAQFAINQMSHAEVTTVDVYAKATTIKPHYWPIWVEINNNLRRFMNRKQYILPERNVLQDIWFKCIGGLYYIYLILRLRIKSFIKQKNWRRK